MRKLALLTVLVITGVITVLFLKAADPGYYRLTVVNNTTATVDTIRVFGTAAVAAASVEQLQAGQSAELNVKLNKQGQLRFEVMRGYNRVDAIFEQDIASTGRQQQWLLLHDNNRFVLRDSAPVQ
jgi:hypothetical protein